MHSTRYIHVERCYIFLIWCHTMVYYKNIARIHWWRQVGVAFSLDFSPPRWWPCNFKSLHFEITQIMVCAKLMRGHDLANIFLRILNSIWVLAIILLRIYFPFYSISLNMHVWPLNACIKSNTVEVLGIVVTRLYRWNMLHAVQWIL